MIILYILLSIIAAFLLYVGFLAICSLFVDPNKEYTHNSRFYRAILNGASAMAFKFLRVKIHTSGIEKIPKGQRMLFVGNHRSNFDPIVEWLVLKQWEIAFISKADNFKVPFFGRFIRKCCFMAIDRENPRKALITINNAIQLLCEDEVSIGVYPEGTRSKSGQLLPFHDSVFRIAKKAERPIVIMSIRGTEDIHKNVMKRRTDVYLDIVKVLSADEIKDKKTHEIGECVKTALEASLSGAVQR